jgi:hypothetical protein
VLTATVNSLNVHTERHNDLEIRILRLIISHSDLDSLIRDLNHLKIILHLLLQDSVVQDDTSATMDTS